MSRQIRVSTPTRVYVWRYVAGRRLSGARVTNATWFRPATTEISDPTVRVYRRDRLPGWRRTLFRLGVPAALAVTGTAEVVAPVATEATLGALLAAGAAYGTRKSARAIRARHYRRTVIRPLAAALAPVVEIAPVDLEPRLELPPAGTPEGTGVITIPLPDHYAGRTAQIADVSRIVAQRLGGEWDTGVNLRQHPFYVRYTPKPAPPGIVTYEMVREAVLSTTQDRPVLGLGTRSEVVHLDFTGEIAHLAASIGTGGGKSSFLRFLVAQFAYHGVRDFCVCDVKWISLQGMEDVPGLTTHRDVEEIWDAIALERAEMDRRYVEKLHNPKMTFPRRVVILEEQNAFALESLIRWREIRPKGDKRALPPVWGDIALLLLKARQVDMNLIGVYQRMSAEAAGGGTYRDQYGLKLLSRFSPQAWDTLVGTRPRGVSSAIPGRAIAILGGLHRTVQLPYITPEEAMELATSGAPVAPVTRPASDTTHQGVTAPRVSQAPVSQPDQTPRYTLAEAAQQPWCPKAHGALRMHKSRYPDRWPTGTVCPDGHTRWTIDELAAALDTDLTAASVDQADTVSAE